MRLIGAVAGFALALTSVAALADDPKPNDAQIAYTAGQIDINSAKLALEKSKNKEVRDFAENMVRDHTAVNDQALALVKKLNVTPQDYETSKALVKQAETGRTQETGGRGVRQGLCKQRSCLSQGSRQCA